MKRLAINLICTGSNTKNSIRHSQNALNDVCQRARGKLNSRPNQFGQRNHGDYPHQLTLNLTKQLRRPNCTRSMHLASLRSRNAEVCEWRGTVFFFTSFCSFVVVRSSGLPHIWLPFFFARASQLSVLHNLQQCTYSINLWHSNVRKCCNRAIWQKKERRIMAHMVH